MCTPNEMCECGKRHHDSAEFWRKAYYERCEEGTKREIEWTNRATKAEQELEQVSAHWKHLFDNVIRHNDDLNRELQETRENCANEGAVQENEAQELWGRILTLEDTARTLARLLTEALS